MFDGPKPIHRYVKVISFDELYDVGAAQCFDACFVFMHLPVGSVVTEHDEQRLTETFFVSANELHNAKL